MAAINLKRRPDHIPTPEESYDALFGTAPVKGDIVKLKFEELLPYPNQPFKAYSDEKLIDLAEDIKSNGILSPIVVKPINSEDNKKRYMILSGHNRANACNLAGVIDIPAIVKDVDDDTAQLIMVNANLHQRDKLLPSEKAFAYKMQLEVSNSQGKRTDLLPNGQKANEANNLLPIGQKVDNHEKISELNSDNKRNIARYIRLTHLIPSLLEKVDMEELPFRAGVELSYLSTEGQNVLWGYIREQNKKISLKQAEALREYCKSNTLTTQAITGILNPPKTTPITLNTKKITSLIPEDEREQAEEYILKALEFYRQNHN